MTILAQVDQDARRTARRRASVAVVLMFAVAWWHAATAQQQTFAAWLEQFRSDALAAGISPATVDAALSGLEPLEDVVARDRNQAEFTMDFRTYLARVVPPGRVEEGRRVLATHEALLRDVGTRYGMPPELLAAVWGVESNFGQRQGDYSVVQALATLAHDGRRGAMFRRELLNALRILDQGHVALDAMKGSWAGAMGHLQFMPSTFIAYAKDGDGDGRKDIWGSAADALESAANFMSAGWHAEQRWGRQVRLPPGFDRSLAGLSRTRTLSGWHALGVRLPDGSPLPQASIRASIIIPDEGSREPAFIVYQNFRALLRWNRSHFFALAVGHLADRIGGGPALDGF